MGEMIYCPSCGHEVHRTARNCPACGAPVVQKRYKDKIAATVLAFFLGGLGIHRFYLGQWWGLFYLLFSCTGIPSFISFIECIVFLCTSQESWDNKHNDGQSATQSSSSAVVWIVVGVAAGLMVFVAVIGILAAIALPSYQDYTKRTVVATGITAASGLKTAEAEYIASTGKFPPNIEATGFQPANLPAHVSSITLDQQSQSIVIAYDETLYNKSVNIGVSLNNGNLEFSCYSQDMPKKYLPQNCRN
jgi:TM2 domain-containing membrane protein YozV/Tfp pilus assembly major pilin PilA